MKQEHAFNAFALDNAADRHRRGQAAALQRDHHAVEYLHALFLALEDPLMDVDRIAYPDVGEVFFDLAVLDHLEDFVLHDCFSVQPAVPGGALSRFSACSLRCSDCCRRHSAMAGWLPLS